MNAKYLPLPVATPKQIENQQKAQAALDNFLNSHPVPIILSNSTPAAITNHTVAVPVRVSAPAKPVSYLRASAAIGLTLFAVAVWLYVVKKTWDTFHPVQNLQPLPTPTIPPAEPVTSEPAPQPPAS